MKIRYKILLILALILIILVTTFLATANSVMYNSIRQDENQKSIKNAQRFQVNLDFLISSINNNVNDWSKWDDTYFFVEDNNTEYKNSNLIPDTYENLQLNMMLFFDNDCELVYGQLFDFSTHTMTSLSANSLAQVTNYPSLFCNDSNSNKKGLISFNDVPMLVASHCILTSDAQGPSHGTLIMGRYLDQSELEHLSLSMGVPLFLSLFDASEMREDFALAMQHLSVDEPFYVQTLNDTSIAGYVLLSDVEGEPFLIVKAVDERTALAYGTAAMIYFIVFLIIVASTIIIVLFVLLERTIISRLATLSETVTKIRATNDNHKRVPIKWNDELSSLGQNINGMLDEINQHTYALEQTVAERTKDLVENRKRLESILQASPDAIVTIGLDGKIIELNARVCELSGFSREELIGQNSLLFVSENRREKFYQETSAILNSPGPLRFEIYFLKKDGAELPVEFSINLIRDEDDRPVGIVGIIRDLSEKKALEQRLIQSQRLAAIGELSGMIAHDIRNPLAAIRNADYYLKRKCSGRQNSEVAAMFSIIDKSIDHANSIINDLLEYSVELRLLLVQSTPKRLMAKALQVMLLPSNIQLVDLTTDVPFKVDETKVVRVFTNLIKNAIDAMPAGGTLEVKSWQENGYVHISFSDTGEGIPPDTLKKLFTPLFTTKAQGMGFGLSISKRIVEAHGGKISVDSRQGQGTTFTVTFPLEPKLNAHDRAGFADRLTSDSSDPI